MNFIDTLGNGFINFIDRTGEMMIFLWRVVVAAVQPPFRPKLILEQMEFVGVGSLFIVLLTGIFTGAVFTLQSVDAFAQVSMESMVGSTVMMAVTRELGPVLTALMVTGRVGSAMATELGTMRVSEQIDAMEVMAVDPIRYLIVPRIIAGIIMVPALVVLFDGIAFLGAYGVGVIALGLDESAYLSRIQAFIDPWDITHGVYKAAVLGLMITLVGCYRGFHAKGGARGVGDATTGAVVTASILVFVLDYILTTILMAFEPSKF